MSMKNLALCIGLFSIIMGWINYDPEIETAVVPIITGIIVVILALLNQIPEMVVCERCGKKVSIKKGPTGPVRMKDERAILSFEFLILN
jgi:DNA-directed RNA polymerase subunit RPC12/RpoP